MDALPLKTRLIERLWDVVDRNEHLLSATLTGSFVDSPTLRGLSDIDFVVVVDHLNRERYSALLREFDDAVRPELARDGYDLYINSTLGPLKFNSPKLAVLHLMLYSHEAHVSHVVNSPFTCLDWQRSQTFRKRSLAEVYPVFGLQPRHFRDGRRSVSDYLRDYRERTVSYRELACDDQGYREIKRSKPMNDRDRHEFAYHVLRFLMRNLLKLTRRELPADDASLVEAYTEVFCDGPRSTADFFRRLSQKKKNLDFASSMAELDHELTAFVEAFNGQFQQHFGDDAVKHVVFRHAPTAANVGPRRFQGRSDLPLVSANFNCESLAEALRETQPAVCFSSPLKRCRQTIAAVRPAGSLPAETLCDDLLEMSYGTCEGLTVEAAKQVAPGLFEAWSCGEDPRFPSGENTADVTARVRRFVNDKLLASQTPTATCTHNVVLRTMIGDALGVPSAQQHRLEIPHATPITFLGTKFGLFVELTPEVERHIFQNFSQANFAHANSDSDGRPGTTVPRRRVLAA